jgi:predicted secreted protein
MKRRVVIVFDVVLLWLLVLAFSTPQVKLAGASATQWSQTYGGTGSDYAYSLVQTGDGGYALAGFVDYFGALGSDCWLVKTDSFGNMQWNKTYGGTGEDWAYSVMVAGDGGYVLSGYTASFGSGGFDCWLIKTGSLGNMEWNKTYGRTGDEQARSLVQTNDGGYALVGGSDSFSVGDFDFWLVKTDSSGNEQWNKTYGGQTDNYAYSLVQADDGGYVLAGRTYVSFYQSNDFWLVKTDSSGNIEWNRTYGGISYDAAFSVIQADDGGYALAGHTESFGAGDVNFWLVKTDSSGSHQWNKTYGGTNSNYQTSLIQTSDGGYALAGYTFSYGVGGGDFWLVKTDSYGNAQWNMTYGGTNADYADSMIQTDDGGYALAGTTYSFGVGGGYGDFWLVKTDENGVVPEFPSLSVLPLFAALTLLVVILAKKKYPKKVDS